MKIITRKEAKELGLKRYFTGEPCHKGHVAERQVVNSQCFVCAKTDRHLKGENTQYYGERGIREHAKRNNEKHYFTGFECLNGHIANRTSSDGSCVICKYNKRKEFRLLYPGIEKATKAKRRAAELNSLPSWANLEEIKVLYINCPKEYEVDHIIPLQGKNVCGLHVPSNLQYLTRSDNASKGRNFTPYYQGKYGWTKPILEVEPISYKEFKEYLVGFEKRQLDVVE